MLTIFGKHGLVQLSQVLNHACDIAIFGIKLADFLLISAVPSQTHLMAARKLVLVHFNVTRYHFRTMFVKEPNGAFTGSRGPVARSSV